MSYLKLYRSISNGRYVLGDIFTNKGIEVIGPSFSMDLGRRISYGKNLNPKLLYKTWNLKDGFVEVKESVNIKLDNMKNPPKPPKRDNLGFLNNIKYKNPFTTAINVINGSSKICESLVFFYSPYIENIYFLSKKKIDLYGNKIENSKVNIESCSYETFYNLFIKDSNNLFIIAEQDKITLKF